MRKITLEPYLGVVSYSGASKYQTCPWMFYQEYVLGNRPPFKRNEAVDIGSMVDWLIERIVKFGNDKAMRQLNQGWGDLMKKYQFASPHKDLIVELSEKAVGLLPTIGYHPSLPKEFQYEVRTKDNALMAIIDFLYVSRGGRCAVMDWKTSKYNYTDHAVRQSDQLKLGCYLARQETKYNPSHYGYVVMNKSNRDVYTHIVKYTDEDERYVRHKYGQIIRAVRESVFYKNPNSCSSYFGSECWHYNQCWGKDKKIRTSTSSVLGGGGFNIAE